ncbi:hypothetical protein [Amycolatopsis sp. NPDC004079]|uniref:hypothetical protein n=1 Tax=Amycolatopsis sp. NPDC004079 TaxID=3154549 RepID=UPI0033B4A7FA
MKLFRRRERDLLLEDVDLAQFAPYAEAERYLLVYPTAAALNYVLVVVYESGGGQRVHVAHSPGITPSGAGMENFVEWIATGVRLRDDRAIALLTGWPTDRDHYSSHPDPDELMRSHFAPCRRKKAATGKTVLLNSAGEVENVLVREQECLYESPSFFPRLPAAEWSRILGTEVRKFSRDEWKAAADQIDPDRSIRDHTDAESARRHAMVDAHLKEMGVE